MTIYVLLLILLPGMIGVFIANIVYAFGYSLNSLGIDVAAKTGTAEVKQSQDDTTGSENSFLFTYDYANHNYLTLTMFEGSTGDWTAIKHVDSLLTYLNTTYQ